MTVLHKKIIDFSDPKMKLTGKSRFKCYRDLLEEFILEEEMEELK